MSKLFWLVYGKNDDVIVLIQSAGSWGFARLKAAIAGMQSKCSQCFELDARMARKVPKKLIGTPLTQKQANALLKKLH